MSIVDIFSKLSMTQCKISMDDSAYIIKIFIRSN